MGLIINSNKSKKILINGTSIELPSVYGRMEFAGRADGKTLEIAISTFASKEAFKNGASNITTDVPQGNINVQLSIEETQSTDTAHKYAALEFKKLGYTVEIDL